MRRVFCAGPRLLAIASSLIIAGCGDDLDGSDTIIGSCEIQTGEGHLRCIEYEGVVTSEEEMMERQLCEPLNTWRTTACDPVGLLGGCRIPARRSSGSEYTITFWFYRGGDIMTSEDVMARCAQQMPVGEFVPPPG
jgi:hypothetical protein